MCVVIHGDPSSVAVCQGFTSACFPCGVFILFSYLSSIFPLQCEFHVFCLGCVVVRLLLLVE
jgi:hypothetical protein